MSRSPAYVFGLMFVLSGYMLGCDSGSIELPEENPSEEPLPVGTFIATYELSQVVNLSGPATFGQFTRNDTIFFALIMETEVGQSYNGGSYSLSLANVRLNAPLVGEYQIGPDMQTVFFPFLGYSRPGMFQFTFPSAGTLVINESRNGVLRGTFSMTTSTGRSLKGRFDALLTEDLNDGNVLTHRF